MRELKFRAWSIKKHEFLNIDTLYCADGKVCAVVDNGVVYDIEDVILEQDTCLEDKNGKEICEGDVLESTWNCDKAVVIWNDVEGEWQHYADFNTHSKYSGSVIIGNIHENPELLKEEE